MTHFGDFGQLLCKTAELEGVLLVADEGFQFVGLQQMVVASSLVEQVLQTPLHFFIGSGKGILFAYVLCDETLCIFFIESLLEFFHGVVWGSTRLLDAEEFACLAFLGPLQGDADVALVEQAQQQCLGQFLDVLIQAF